MISWLRQKSLSNNFYDFYQGCFGILFFHYNIDLQKQSLTISYKSEWKNWFLLPLFKACLHIAKFADMRHNALQRLGVRSLRMFSICN